MNEANPHLTHAMTRLKSVMCCVPAGFHHLTLATTSPLVIVVCLCLAHVLRNFETICINDVKFFFSDQCVLVVKAVKMTNEQIVWLYDNHQSFTDFFLSSLLFIARKRHSDDGAAQLLLPVLPPSRDTAHLHLPSHHIPHSGGFC